MNFLLYPVLIIAGLLAGWSASSDFYRLKYQGELSTLRAEYAQATAEVHAEYQQQLNQQLHTAKAAERGFLEKQRTLNQQTQQLKARLTHAQNNPIPVCGTAYVFGAQWMQHYRQALGIDRVPTTDTNGSHTSRSIDDAAITPAELLHHLTDYGHWCRANTEQLTALQRSLQGAKL